MDRPGRGGPRRPQQGYEMDEEEYGQRDRRPARENRPREANRAPQPTANGGLAYPLDVAKRLFTAEAPYVRRVAPSLPLIDVRMTPGR